METKRQVFERDGARLVKLRPIMRDRLRDFLNASDGGSCDLPYLLESYAKLRFEIVGEIEGGRNVTDAEAAELAALLKAAPDVAVEGVAACLISTLSNKKR